MSVSCVNFFFHPLHPSHSDKVRILSIITNVALTALTFGMYLILFGIVRLIEKHSVQVGFVGVAALKQKQQDHLVKLKALADAGQWQHLQTHTAHPDSGFDWWMFPIDRTSAGQGDLYKVSHADIAALKNDPQFMKNYRDGVILVAKSWGWDLENRQDITNGIQKWTGYVVRLGKMLDSLRLFGQDDLRQALTHFVDLKGIRQTLEPWVQRLLF